LHAVRVAEAAQSLSTTLAHKLRATAVDRLAARGARVERHDGVLFDEARVETLHRLDGAAANALFCCDSKHNGLL
jgi:hypothetical protein